MRPSAVIYCGSGFVVHTDKMGDSLVVWGAHFGDTGYTVLWDGVPARCNDRGGVLVQVVAFRWGRSGDVGEWTGPPEVLW